MHSLVFLAIVCKDEVLECHLHSYPLLIGQRGPNVVGFCDGSLVRLQDHLNKRGKQVITSISLGVIQYVHTVNTQTTQFLAMYAYSHVLLTLVLSVLT